jgi:MFS family permease
VARNREFRFLLGARTISHIGDGMALVALLLYVQETRASGLAVGALLLAATVPVLVVGPIAGTVVDRTDQRRLMIVCDGARLVLYGAVAIFLPAFPVLLALVAFAAVFDTLFSPAGRSVVPALVAHDDLRPANAWLGISLNLQVVLGPLLGGVLSDAVGVRAAIAANALTFALSALLLARLPSLAPEAVEGEARPRFLADIRAGFAYVAAHRAARVIVGSLFLGVTFAAVDNVALVFLARDELGSGPLGFGSAAAAFGVGMLAASTILVSPRLKVPAATLFVLGMLLNGLGTLATGLAPVLLVAIGLQALAGTGNGVQVVASDTLVQETVTRSMLGRVFGLVQLAAVAGSSVAALAGGLLLDVTSARAVFVIGGTGVLAVLALSWLFLVREPGAGSGRTRS